MPTLTLAEQIVISPAQEIANIVKLKGIQSQERQTGLVGNIITYRKQNEVLLKEMQEMHCESPKFPRPEAIETTLSVVIIGTKLSHASLVPTALRSPNIQVNPEKMYKWIEMNRKLTHCGRTLTSTNHQK